MRSLLILAAVISASSGSLADETNRFRGWVFPGAKLMPMSFAPVSVKSAGTKKAQSVTKGFGQYESDQPFHEVVEFYVLRSGLRPLNWSILGREYPGTDVHIPAHFSRADISRKEPSVTLLHYIRDESAVAHLLVTYHPTLDFITVAITRGKDEERTVIQLIQHSARRIERGTEQSDARETSAQSVHESASTPQPP